MSLKITQEKRLIKNTYLRNQDMNYSKKNCGCRDKVKINKDIKIKVELNKAKYICL